MNSLKIGQLHKHCNLRPIILSNVVLVAMVAILTFMVPLFIDGNVNATTTSANTTATANASSILSLSAPTALSLNMTPTPSGSDLTVASDNITVATNNSSGYALTIGMKSSATSNALIHSTISSATIPSLSSDTTAADFPNNRWGFSLDYNSTSQTGNFKALPAAGSTAEIRKTTGPTATPDTFAFTAGSKVDTDTIGGTYSNILTFTAVTNAPVSPYSITFNENGGDASTLPSPNPMTGTTSANAVTLSGTQPTRSGYTFTSWCTNQVSDGNCTGTAYSPGDSYPIDHAASNEVTLYAVWAAVQPTITSVSPTLISAQDTSAKTITLTGTNMLNANVIKINSDTCAIDTTTKTDTSLQCTISINQSVLDATTSFDEAARDAGISTGLTNMQQMTSTIKSAVSNPTQFAVSVNSNDSGKKITYYQEDQVTDTRDSKTYWIAKLADSNVWMTQNLDLDITTAGLTSADSDINSGTTWKSGGDSIGVTNNYLPQATDTSATTSASAAETDTKSWNLGDYYYDGTTATGCGTTTTSYADCVGKGFNAIGNSHYHVGNLYQWNTATAGSGGTITSAEAKDSICPKGWQLPISNSTGDKSFSKLVTAYSAGSSVQTLINSPIYMVRNGDVRSGFLRNAGGYGRYWSSTPLSNNSRAYVLAFGGTSSVYPSDYAGRGAGFSVRCLAR